LSALSISEIKKSIKNGTLILYGKKVFTKDEFAQIREAQKQKEHYDLLQLTKKIQLNSAYGALLNNAFRFSRRELGASVTGTGRQISIYMAKVIGVALTGRPVQLIKRYTPGTHFNGTQIRAKATPFINEYSSERGDDLYSLALKRNEMQKMLNGLPSEQEHILEKDKETGEMKLVPTSAIYFPMFTDTNEHCPDLIYGDTDSVSGDSTVKTNLGEFQIQELFELNRGIRFEGNKQYAIIPGLKSMCYDENACAFLADVKEIYRHKVSKKKYTISLSNGKSVSVTSDHSLMVKRNDELIQIKPSELQNTDIFICIKNE